MVHYDIFYISYNTPLSDFLFGARRAGASMISLSDVSKPMDWSFFL
jgi:hypothetical protein